MSTTTETPPPTTRKRKLTANPFFWGAVVGIIAIPALRPLLRRVPAPPPVIGKLPDFRFINQHGQPFGSAELRDKVYVANFFFTRCPSICPNLTKAVHKLQQRFEQLGVDIRLVSISIDPENDQPDELLAYGRKYGADFKRWTFLTSKAPQAIRDLVTKGFMTHLGRPERNAQGHMDIVHSGNVMIVDRKGNLRGSYRTEDEALGEVVHRAVHVMLEQGQ